MGALAYLQLLSATLVLELAVAALLAPRAPRDQRRATVLAALALNLLTHPLATALSWLAGTSWLALELAVTLAELLGYRALAPLPWRRASALAVLANLLSALAGLVLAAASGA